MKLGIFGKVDFWDNYWPMQTCLDQPQIQQIYRFMTSSKSNHPSLQFIFNSKAPQARTIYKTIIFVNSISKI